MGERIEQTERAVNDGACSNQTRKNTPELVRENGLASLDLLVERLLQLTETLESRKQGVPKDREVCQCCSILWRTKVGRQLPAQQQ